MDIRSFPGVLLIASLALVPSIFTMLQPDLSGTAFTVMVMMAVLFVGGARFTHILLLAGILLVVGFSAVLVRDDYQLDRIQAVFNGNSLEQDDNYQPIQARITLGSGGPFGRGLGQSRQKRGFLPEAHTDFIMAIIGEESGFAGTFTMLVLFGLLFTGLLRIARAAGSAFEAIAGSGLSAILICGVVIHALVNTGMVPVTGMPLPLISWGGTSMVVNLICIGTVAGMAGRRPNERPNLLIAGGGTGDTSHLPSLWGMLQVTPSVYPTPAPQAGGPYHVFRSGRDSSCYGSPQAGQGMKFLFPFTAAASLLRALKLLKKNRIDAVLGTGGYSSFFAILAPGYLTNPPPFWTPTPFPEEATV